MILDEKYYAVALSIISHPALNNLFEHLNLSSPFEIYNRISHKRMLKTQDFITSKYPAIPIDAAQRIVESSESKSIKIISYWDPEYPDILKRIYRPPIVLFIKGALNNKKSIAIVGTRKSDKRSEVITRRISEDLSLYGYTIVSGMAIGIDREAHMGALECKGRTIGVLANGIDITYPYANRDLYRLIEDADESALISEYPPGIMAGRWTFARRNRIISGLAFGTVVVKAGARSGALITSRYSVEQNREVFACPGHSFDEDYKGCHELIRTGAVLVSSSEDIIRELPDFEKVLASGVLDSWKVEKNDIQATLFPGDGMDEEDGSIEGEILKYLSSGEIDVDSIIRDIQHPVSKIHEAIMLLEFSGKIYRNGNTVSRF